MNIKLKQSAGLLLYKFEEGVLNIFLVHPGGPFFAGKDVGAWSIPKGEIEEGEEPLAVAVREFREETGNSVQGNFITLTPVKQKGGKTVFAWAVESNLPLDAIESNTFEMEWPPKSGRMQQYPEVDRGGWFSAEIAKQKINLAQSAFIDELLVKLRA